MAALTRIVPPRHIKGVVIPPGDKSISHRALMLGAIAQGTTRISGLAPGDDVRHTLAALRAVGVCIEESAGSVLVEGRGIRRFLLPADIDCGNSGTTARLLAGLLAAATGETRLIGDLSLSRRPMRRVIHPLSQMGAMITAQGSGGTLPLHIQGTAALKGISYHCEIASAQVKSAILLAGLYADGMTEVIEPIPTRDHTERMLKAMGAVIRRQENRTQLEPSPLRGIPIRVGGDFSSAAYWIALGVLSRSADIWVRGVNLNPTRTGFLNMLGRMGARIDVVSIPGDIEPEGDVKGTFSELHGVEVGEAEAASMIDELPLLAVIASQAHGITRIRGAAELRVKESDRIDAIVTSLRTMGASIEAREDGFEVHGPTLLQGTTLEGFGDHRIIMSLAIAANIAEGESQFPDTNWVHISYPGFFDELRRLTIT